MSFDGNRCIVPKPNQRASLVQQIHKEIGYFKMCKIDSILYNQYY